MAEKPATDVVRAQEVPSPAAIDPILERAREINELIATRAYELFASRGFTHGNDREDWLRAVSEVLVDVPVRIAETETELAIRADVPGFTEQDLEVRTTPRSVCISGEREETTERKEEKTVYSERRSDQIFRVVDLPAQVDPERVNATLSGGVLQIKLLKVGAGKKIPVGKAATA